MTGLTTHVLDTTRGAGATGMTVRLRGADGRALGEAVLDSKGRAVLAESLEAGVYEIVFAVAAYHRATGAHIAEPPFLDEVCVRFGVAEPAQHHHVPLLVSPYGYSTYRGS